MKKQKNPFIRFEVQCTICGKKIWLDGEKNKGYEKYYCGCDEKSSYQITTNSKLQRKKYCPKCKNENFTISRIFEDGSTLENCTICGHGTRE